VSRDIPDSLCTLSGPFLGLVGLGRVDLELGEELAVVVDDPDVAVGDEEHDAGAGVAAPDAEVQQLGSVAKGDLAGLVDAVSADSMFGGHDQTAPAWRCLGARGEGFDRGASAECAVGADGVVVGLEPVELGLQRGDAGRSALAGEPLLEGLVEALDLAAGLGVVGAGVLVVDAEGDQLEFDGAGPVAALGGEDGPVEFLIVVKGVGHRHAAGGMSGVSERLATPFLTRSSRRARRALEIERRASRIVAGIW
jgi:hypothetical protein